MSSKSDIFKFNRLIVAAYRLPYRFIKRKEKVFPVQNSGGLVSAMLSLAAKNKFQKEVLWIGAGEDHPKGEAVNNIMAHAVKIPDTLNEEFYGGFCNNLIWPLFHYFPSLIVFEDSYYDAYLAANKLYCEKLVEVIKPGDFVWIHDYQLFLLPEMLRHKVPDITIGFFLHIPFPSFELFRLIPRHWRNSIIDGILGADLIGFHTNDYLQYFLKTVKRTLGYAVHENIIRTNERIVRAGTFPIGIDYNKFSQSITTHSTLTEKGKLKSYLLNKKLIFSVDRLDYSKGFLYRLKGFELFLEKYPEWLEKVVFNMVVVPSRDTIDRYKDMKKEIEATVGRINGRYSNLGWRPITYQYKSLSFSELVALYGIADVALITPLRDGMNLVSKEFIACQSDKSGVLILSEMAGAASELIDALLINPIDTHELADSIDRALRMSKYEKDIRIKKMQNRIKAYDIDEWANDFLKYVHLIKREQEVKSGKLISDKIQNAIRADYNKSKNRIILFDYDGTLVPFKKNPEQAVLDTNTMDLLTKMADDKSNLIIIVSGRERKFLERQFHDLRAIIVAEHGYYIKPYKKQWIEEGMYSLDWKKPAIEVLQKYVERCNGTFIEEKKASIAWHYRNAEDDYINLKLLEIKDELSDVLKEIGNLTILEGKKVIEIKGSSYNKGTTINKIISEMHYDYILSVGDDKTDEDLFAMLPKTAVTIKIGREPSHARFCLKSQKLLYPFLKSLLE